MNAARFAAKLFGSSRMGRESGRWLPRVEQVSLRFEGLVGAGRILPRYCQIVW